MLYAHYPLSQSIQESLKALKTSPLHSCRDRSSERVMRGATEDPTYYARNPLVAY